MNHTFYMKLKKKTRENSPLLLPHPDILRNFFRNCIRVGLSGGELVACLLVVLLLPPGIPDCDSNEYWRDSNDACRGDAWVLKKKIVKMTYHEYIKRILQWFDDFFIIWILIPIVIQMNIDVTRTKCKQYVLHPS